MMRGNQRIIYVNAFLGEMTGTYFSAGGDERVPRICDGSEALFGVEYDVKRARFSDVVFDGGW